MADMAVSYSCVESDTALIVGLENEEAAQWKD